MTKLSACLDLLRSIPSPPSRRRRNLRSPTQRVSGASTLHSDHPFSVAGYQSFIMASGYDRALSGKLHQTSHRPVSDANSKQSSGPRSYPFAPVTASNPTAVPMVTCFRSNMPARPSSEVRNSNRPPGCGEAHREQEHALLASRARMSLSSDARSDLR